MADANGTVNITVLGSGTSVGVPTIGCHCKVCTSPDPRDRRLRPSISVRRNGRLIIVDTGPDFRQQALRAGIERVDAVLYTHAHADHILGLDDLRPYNFHQNALIPIYSSADTLAVIRRVFAYIFEEKETESSRPKIETHLFDEGAFSVCGIEVVPIPLRHGKDPVHGFRFGPVAYLTDHSDIPEDSIEKLRGLDVLFLDALRYKPHPTHSTVERSLQYVEQIAPKRAWFTHISHDLGHERAESFLPDNVRLAYDGLQISVEAA
jgi:phosphoribosyl 1,2-cyclic phosphate phosphodiesterase